MFQAVADTHALIWYVYADSRLSPAARAAFDQAVAESGQIGFSSISLVEIVYLIEKGRVKAETLDRLLSEIERDETVLVELPLDKNIVEMIKRVPRDQVPDMPDRIIAATALFCNVPVISRDGKIQLSKIQTIW